MDLGNPLSRPLLSLDWIPVDLQQGFWGLVNCFAVDTERLWA